jgi:hypothetical protein
METAHSMTATHDPKPADDTPVEANPPTSIVPVPANPVEIGGRGGLDPTRYGDWEKNGRCIDF